MTHSDAVLSEILEDFFPSTAERPLRFAAKQLYGGYSGSNYLITLEGDAPMNQCILKVCNGYDEKTCNLMARTSHFLRHSGNFKGCCCCVPLALSPDPPGDQEQSLAQTNFVSLAGSGVPAVLLDFIPGIAADKLLFDTQCVFEKKIAVMEGIGQGLSGMHGAVAVPADAEIAALGVKHWSLHGGCCDLRDQLQGVFLEKIWDFVFRKGDPENTVVPACPVGSGSGASFVTAELLTAYMAAIRAALKTASGGSGLTTAEGSRSSAIPPERAALFVDYLDFYTRELTAFLESVGSQLGTPKMGLVHGDPFCDNVMVEPDSGAFSGFVDVEDLSVGPVVFDLAVCAIGSAFRIAETSAEGTESAETEKNDDQDQDPQVLDLALFRALLRGYRSRNRTLPPSDAKFLVPWMKLALLCNSMFRFVKFNVDFFDEAKFGRNEWTAYLELQKRAEHLGREGVAAAVEKMVVEELLDLD